MDEELRDYLRDRGFAPRVDAHVLLRLTQLWEGSVESLECGALDARCELLHALGTRRLLCEALLEAAAQERRTAEPRVRDADNRYRALTREDGGVYFKAIVGIEGYSSDKYWFFFRAPSKALPYP